MIFAVKVIYLGLSTRNAFCAHCEALPNSGLMLPCKLWCHNLRLCCGYEVAGRAQGILEPEKP